MRGTAGNIKAGKDWPAGERGRILHELGSSQRITTLHGGQDYLFLIFTSARAH